MYELKIPAIADRVDEVTDRLDEILEEHGCPMKAQVALDIAVEEIFVNIAHYSYPDGVGDVRVLIELTADDSAVSIRFIDQGVPYDPLRKKDPDITLGLEERPIGGLGIFMVKQSMDDVTHEYKDGSNILTIRKDLK